MKIKCPCCNEEINLSIFLNREVKKKNTDPQELQWIAEIVCNNSGLSLEDFKQIKQTRDLVKPRQQFMWLSFKFTNYDKTQIARFIREGMNHSTVIHGIKAIDDLIASSSQERIEMDYLIDKVEEKLLLNQLQAS